MATHVLFNYKTSRIECVSELFKLTRTVRSRVSAECVGSRVERQGQSERGRERERLKRLINGFKTYKTFDLTRRVNNIIGLRHCRRSASLCSSDLLKCQKLVGSLFRHDSRLDSRSCRSRCRGLCATLHIYFDLNAL